MNPQAIASWCEVGNLPESDELYSTLLTEDGLFSDVEGVQWDFKEAWPYSLSDEYFGGIARLICAFANSLGGVIIFGVHDKKRTGGHNKVKWNIDHFKLAISQLLDSLPQMEFRSYQNSQTNNVDVLLIKPRANGTPALRFNKQIGKYKANVLWIRSGH